VGTLLDAYALVALLEDEPAASDVERIVGSGQSAIPSINLAEVGQRILRHSAVGSQELRSVVSSLPISVIPLSETHAWRAADLRARHYHPRYSAVSLADCCLVAVATPADRVATADPAVLRMAVAEGIATVELPAAS
jgi:PIN domain nuclease of toxin-antitoxin system